MVEEHFVEANSLRFRVLSEGSGERLALCLHGFPECAHSWRHQLPLLAELGFRAWAPDLRGYGGTDTPAGNVAYALEALIADVDGLIDAAGARGRTFLAAHDWGAIIAWYYAMRHPDALERLAILNVPHPSATSGRLPWRQLLRSWYVLFFQLPWLPEAMLRARGPGWPVEMMRRTSVHPERFDDAAMTHFEANAARPGAAEAMLAYYRAAFRGGGARRQLALGHPMIETPTLMIWGEQDVALTRELTFGTSGHVRDLTLRYLPDASHWVQQDQPELVNEMLSAWVEGREVPHAPGASGDLG